ncbi:hypothetical protein PR202_gb23957 [Eleusine coracana subsp. coracana]|uniref:Phospholipid/glycerol acyltransferase domain-containing protein n=1 Tax=Eleusine coracana subsp. coracana TaxID=191504 RepID=A0AAV5FK09_ELECO|nr:hypothetical protein PR202_gb23957 [Eleusine coracana subsp. coracana]
MLVALEAGGFHRGLALLLLYPLILLLALGNNRDLAMRAMACVAFCGLRARSFRAGRAVLPRWLLEDAAAEALDVVARLAGGGGSDVGSERKKKVVLWASAMPRVMVEPFLREYLLVPAGEVVAAREMRTVCGFYTGLMDDDEFSKTIVSELRKKKRKEAGGCDDDDDNDVVGFSGGGSMDFLRTPIASICKVKRNGFINQCKHTKPMHENWRRDSDDMHAFYLTSVISLVTAQDVYVVSAEEQSKWRRLARSAYPRRRPLVFHDGRLAFLPTPSATLAMYTWLPLGAVLSLLRLGASLTLPYRLATLLHAATGQSWRLRGSLPPRHVTSSGDGGQLYACNHRTLIDPVYVSIALDRPVRAVSYSLSRVSDFLSPIGPTVHLARDRAQDGAAMARLLASGARVVVCPEGTTCREPYLLRFSPLFAELAGGENGNGVVPVALAVETSMFYGTTAGGWKGVDPFYYLANPRMCYTVEFLDRVDTAEVREGKVASTDVANRVQRDIAEALGYECTMLTRRDKYRVLAGNDGTG